jgi:hypothetical protein
MMKPAARRYLSSLLGLLLFLATPTQAQQQSPTISELKQQIALMERVDRDPNTTPDVRKENSAFLMKRRAALQSLLQKTIADLKRYKSIVGPHLTSEEIEKVDGSLRALEQEAQGLNGEMAPLSSSGDLLRSDRRAGPADTDSPAPRDGTVSVATAVSAAVACPAKPDDLIGNAYLFAPSGATASLFIEKLSAPLSLTQDSDVIVSPASQLTIPQAHFQIITQHGTVSKIYAESEYQPAKTKSGEGRKRLEIILNTPPPAGDTEVRVRLVNLRFECSTDTSPAPTLIAAANKSGTVYDATTFDAATQKEYDAAIAGAKSPDRKAFSAGFSAAKGDGAKAQGAGDFLINKNFSKDNLKGTILDLFDQVNLSFQVKKSSAENVDPRYLNLGLTFRKTFLIFTPKRPETLTGVSAADIAASMQKATETLRQSRNKGFFRVAAIGGGLKLEGEAFDFKTVNFVTDPSIEVGSIAKRLGSKGYYNLSFIGGAEVGRNMSKPDAKATGGPTAAALNKVNWIARLMGGGQMTLRYLPTSNTGDHWGVELNLAYAIRHLFENEVFTDTTANGGKSSTIGMGNKPWKQADLKLFLFGDEKARYGFKFSYMNGALPPAFSRTRGFQYGFIVETTDDKTNGQAANK